MVQPSISDESRDPAASTLDQIVRDHFETFRAQAASLRDGEGLPRFVEQEFRDFLRCGGLAGGFARFRCAACGLDRLVAFSCKGRGFCPSCGGRRMAERAAHLMDSVFPDVPVRQCRGPQRGNRAGVEWVLSLPYRVRYRLAWDHDLCRAVVAVFLRAVLGALRARARGDGVADGRGGAVAIVQRFGGALNLNVHVHALVLDGVFARDGVGALVFHPAARLTTLDVAEVLATAEPRITRLLERCGVGDRDDEGSAPDAWAEEAPVLAGLAAVSVQGTVALGRQRGARVRRFGGRPEAVEATALDFVVVMFPTDERLWSDNSRFIRVARSDQTRSVKIDNMPPADYYLAAFDDVDPDQVFEPGFLQDAKTHAITVNLNEGDKKAQELRLGSSIR